MAQIISFYSYKGGVGRSLCLANVAALLARRGRRVVCVDCDLEAGGLHTIFQVDPETVRNNILDVILGNCSIKQGLLRLDHLVADREPGGELWLLPAISEVGLVDRVMADQTDLIARVGRIIRQIEEHLFPNYILVDSRSGFAHLAAMAIRNAERLVCVLRPNRQNADGLRRLLQLLEVMRVAPTPFLVLSQVPNADNVVTTRAVIARRLKELELMIGPGRRFGATIPYAPALALEESVVTLTDPEGALAANFHVIADWIDGDAP